MVSSRAISDFPRVTDGPPRPGSSRRGRRRSPSTVAEISSAPLVVADHGLDEGLLRPRGRRRARRWRAARAAAGRGCGRRAHGPTVTRRSPTPDSHRAPSGRSRADAGRLICSASTRTGGSTPLLRQQQVADLHRLPIVREHQDLHEGDVLVRDGGRPGRLDGGGRRRRLSGAPIRPAGTTQNAAAAHGTDGDHQAGEPGRSARPPRHRTLASPHSVTVLTAHPLGRTGS